MEGLGGFQRGLIVFCRDCFFLHERGKERRRHTNSTFAPTSEIGSGKT